MKKILYILSISLFLFTSCDPMDDVYKEVDEANKEAKADAKFFAMRTLLDENYTLVDADYELSTNEGLKKYKSFSSKATAKDNLAQILNDKMVYGKAGKDYKVTYKFYRGKLSYVKAYLEYLDAVGALETYELTDADYDSMGTGKGEPGKYNNFSEKIPAAKYLPDFLKKKFPDAKANDIIVVTYKFFDGKVRNITENWVFDGTVWAENPEAGPKAPKLPTDVTVYELVAGDYDSMGAPGKYDNFSSSQKPQNYLPTFLGVKFPYAKEGTKYLVVYKFYGKKKKNDEKNSTFKEALEYTLTDGVWKPYSSVVPEVAVMSYKVGKKTWEFVPPIAFVKTEEPATAEYTLTPADYELVGNGHYRNFDIREGKPEADETVIIQKLTIILKSQTKVEIKPDNVYAVTFTYYDGKKGDKTINLKAVLAE